MSLPSILLAALLATRIAPSPPDREAETAAQLRARLESIAADAAEVGKTEDQALLLLAVAEHESAFAIDVDMGPCYRGADGKSKRCDSGRAACMMQVQAGAERRAELFADRKACFRTGLQALRSSRARCKDLPPAEQFASYAAGSCMSAAGRRASRELYASWQNWKRRANAHRDTKPAERVASDG